MQRKLLADLLSFKKGMDIEMGKSKSKTWIKGILLIIGIILLYEIFGAIVPFIYTKTVSDDYKKTVSLDKFYEDDLLNDRASVVESNEEALDIRLSMFEEAEKSIVLSTFDMREGESTNRILSSLVNTANRGVKVQILVDGMYGLLHMAERPIFYAAGSHKNIEIKFYNIPNPIMPWTINGRMHDKYILVDHKLLLMGGRNSFDYFLGKYPNQSVGYDREVLVYHKSGKQDKKSAVTQVREYFKKVWSLSVCGTVFDTIPKRKEKNVIHWEKKFSNLYKQEKRNIKAYNFQEKTVPIKHAEFVTNPTHIYAKQPYVWYELQTLMKDADHSVLIQSPYAVFSKDMYKGIEEIASHVPNAELLINSVAVGDNFVASSDYTHNWKKVYDTGIEVKEYFGAWSAHGKSILIDDDISVIGSYNFDMRSTYVDTETMLVVYGKEFNKELSQKIGKMEQQSLVKKEDGSYEKRKGVKEKQMPKEKEYLFWFTSKLIQPFRYLA